MSSPAAETTSWIFLERASLDRFLKDPSAIPTVKPDQELEKRARQSGLPRGRRPKHKWEFVGAEFARMVLDGEILPDASLHSVAKTLADWMGEQGLGYPEIATIERQLRVWRSVRDWTGEI